MVRKTEAIFVGGVLRPLEPLGLREQERVRITVEPVQGADASTRAKLLEEFFAEADRIGFRSNGAYPTRDELHERR